MADLNVNNNPITGGFLITPINLLQGLNLVPAINQAAGNALTVNTTTNNNNVLTPPAAGPLISQPNAANSGGLKIESDSVITTPGGFKVETLGQFEWKITGPDGKFTRIWGDPHVQESDAKGDREGTGGWDFKRSSTFVLADGTRINATTTPWEGNRAMTVTKKLEIINGNDRLEVTDIDKGKGKIGNITKDGFSKVNSFYGDVFVMANGEADDWTLNGREVVGSRNGGASFILGSELGIKTSSDNLINGNWWSNPTSSTLNDTLFNLFNLMLKVVSTEAEKAQKEEKTETPENVNTDRVAKLKDLFRTFTDMVTTLRSFAEMNKQVLTATNTTAAPIKV
jgi:hypothetical protein